MQDFRDVQSPLLVLAFSAALIALMVSYTVDAEPLGAQISRTQTRTPLAQNATFEPPTLAPSAIVLTGVPSYRLEPEMLQIFFAPSSTEIPLGAENALQEIVTAIESQPARVRITGFHDTTGNPQQNIVLAKQRAEKVQKRLIALGVAATAIEVKKPGIAIAGIDHSEARRVEITWAKNR